MLKIIYGTAGTGKSRFIYESAKENIKNNKRTYILVPEQYSMYAEKSMLCELGLSAQTHVEVLTFSRLCNLVLNYAGPLRLNYIDSAGKYIMSQRALHIEEKNLKYFKSNVHQQGFAKVVAGLMSEFKRYGISKDTLKEAAQNTEINELSLKLSDLSAIFETYNRLIEEKYSDAEDNLSAICTKIKECPFLEGIMYINHFKSFTPVEYKVVGELMKKMDICISFCCDDLSDREGIFSPVSNTYKNLLDMADLKGIKNQQPIKFENEVKFKDNSELLHLKQNFFADFPKAFEEDPKNIIACSPKNYYDEVVNTAITITKLCREKGYKFSDFLVLSANMDSYNGIIPEIFSKYKINFFMDKKRDVSSSPLIKMVLALLEILSYGFSYERVMTIARSGFIKININDIDVFENYLLASNITHKQWRDEEDWIYNPSPKIFDMERINCAKHKILRPIVSMLGAIRGRKTVSDICKMLGLWLSENEVLDTVKIKVSILNNKNKLDKADEYRQTWNTLVTLLSQLSDTMKNDFITYTKFYEIFSSACGELSVGVIPPAIDQVLISEIDRFRNTNAKVVIVLGVNDGVFPKGYSHEGLISDKERDELLSLGIELAPTAFIRQQEEQILVYNVLTTASEILCISSPLADKEGKPLNKSGIVQKLIKEIFPKTKIISEENTNILDILEGESAIFDRLISQIAKANGAPLTGVWKDIFKYFTAIPEYKKQIEDIINCMDRLGKAEVLSKEKAKLIYGMPLWLSASKLEKYNACAFSYFMKYGLIAKQRLKAGFASNNMGSVLHLVLSEYFERLNKNHVDYSEITKEECQRETDFLVDRAAKDSDELLYETSAYYKYLIMRMKNIAKTTAWEIIKFYRQSEFRPYGFEIKIGDGGQIPPKRVFIEGGEAHIEGFVDRADFADIGGEKYISILDYKSSEKKLSGELADAGIQFQPLIYSNILCESIEGASPAAMLYMHMNDPLLEFNSSPTLEELDIATHKNVRINGWVLNKPSVSGLLDSGILEKDSIKYVPSDKASLLLEDEFKERLEKANKKIKSTAQNIADGIIEIKPYISKSYNACTYCDYAAVCNIE